MTYTALASTFGKQAVQIVELYLTFCQNTYGVAPCTASLTKSKCYNTFASCRDTPNFAVGTKVYRFSSVRVDNIQEAGDAPTFPTLLNVDTSPTVLTPGKGLGIRSTVDISIADHPWTDAGIDPYLTDRTAGTSEQGTFWGKMVSRNRYYQNRRLDVLTGYLNEDGTYSAENFKRRSYVIESITGPNPDGRVQIHAVDPLKFADGEKSKWPYASKAVLSADVSTGATALAITDSGLQLSDWWSAGQRYVRVDQEIMKATSASGLGTSSVTLNVTRVTMPAWYDYSLNLIAEHAEGATVQFCWLFEDAMVYDIVYFFLHDVAGIDASYLAYSSWKSNIDTNFPYLSLSTLLTDPVAVKDLLTEITELSVLVWWHERDQKVYLKGLRFEQSLGAQINDDTVIVRDSVQVTEAPKDLITQFWLYHDIAWPLGNPKLLSSFRIIDIRANLDRETDQQYGKPAIREVRSRWLNQENTSIAAQVGGTMLRQYSDVRKIVSFTMDTKDDIIWVGDMVGIGTKYVHGIDGLPAEKNYLITQVEEAKSEAGVVLKCVACELFTYARAATITHPSGVAPDPTPAPSDYSSANAADRLLWAFICYDTPSLAPEFLDGSPAYQIQ